MLYQVFSLAGFCCCCIKYFHWQAPLVAVSSISIGRLLLLLYQVFPSADFSCCCVKYFHWQASLVVSSIFIGRFLLLLYHISPLAGSSCCCIRYLRWQASLVGVSSISIGRLLLFLLSYQLFMQQKYFFASTLNSLGRSHVGSFFTNEKQKKGWLMA